MKRSALKRGEPLRPDPEKVRAFLQRRRPRKARVSHAGARSEALRRSGGRCIVCGERAVHGHHALPVSKWPELTNVADGIIGLCERCHAQHHAAMRRVRWEELPECVIVLAQTTSGAAALYLERVYPRA